jgi:hypothetical protein
MQTAAKTKRVNRKKESLQVYFNLLVNTLAYDAPKPDPMDLSVILNSIASYAGITYSKDQVEQVAPYEVFKDRL